MGDGVSCIADWAVSSRPLDSQPITINGNPVDVTFPLGGAYLIHPTASLSILERLVVAMAAGGVVNPSAVVTQSRRVLLSGDAAWSLTWGASTAFRDLLGFAGDLAAASSYLAPATSTLLWSPGKRLRPVLAPLDAHGRLVLDMSATIGEGGQLTVRQEGPGTTVALYQAQYVYKPRFWAAPPTVAPGEFRHFWRFELVTAQRFIILREITEDDATDTAASYAGATVLGPYVADMAQESMGAAQFARSDGFGTVEFAYDVELPAIVTPEFAG